MLGHRGFTHSIFFAALLAGLVTFVFFQKNPGSPLTIFLFLFLSTLSHPVLDALTNGGLGVGLFAPFSNERYFFRLPAHRGFTDRSRRFLFAQRSHSDPERVEMGLVAVGNFLWAGASVQTDA